MGKTRKTPEIDRFYDTFIGERHIGDCLYLGKIPKFGLGLHEAIAQRRGENDVRCWWLDEYTLEGRTLRLPANAEITKLAPGPKSIIRSRVEKTRSW